ncbi:ABC transporter ATP-binding protein [Sulfurimonas sp.]|uniref:metal ABC transporter ATP-binding protein n=1 Tax=Sulfurimonas sp. TaxID=2022749 RepID=UPI002B4A6BAE|nr:ABC transporter ATP-binding protein [Sulfurimonas sp.]
MLVIEINNLSFAYDKELVLEDINLSVYDKDFLVLIGPNGGGKSTLMKLILGINNIQNGSIIFLNKPSNNMTNIGYVPQNTNINVNFPIKVIEVVMMGGDSRKSSIFGYREEEVNHAIAILKQVGMQDYANKKIASLSGGQRQRVMIARALYSNPKILLLDEPTSSIDAQGQKQIYELLNELSKRVAVIVISHDLSVILDYATKVAHVNKKLSYHDLSSLKKEFKTSNNHICEVELLQMLGRCKC